MDKDDLKDALGVNSMISLYCVATTVVTCDFFSQRAEGRFITVMSQFSFFLDLYT